MREHSTRLSRISRAALVLAAAAALLLSLSLAAGASAAHHKHKHGHKSKRHKKVRGRKASAPLTGIYDACSLSDPKPTPLPDCGDRLATLRQGGFRVVLNYWSAEMSVDENLRYADSGAVSRHAGDLESLQLPDADRAKAGPGPCHGLAPWHVGLLHRGRGATGGSRPGAGALRSGAQHHSQAAALRIAAQPIHASTLQRPGGLRRARRLSLRALGPAHLPDVPLVLADGPQPGDGPPGLLLVDRLPQTSTRTGPRPGRCGRCATRRPAAGTRS